MSTTRRKKDEAPALPSEPALTHLEEQREIAAFPVVGIGASAGGLEAFTQLLAHLPKDTGMAFVLVQHLDPTHDSQLAELLSKTTHLPVTEVTEGLAVTPNQVYVIPPNTNMAMMNGVLRLSPRGDARNQHLPLNVFFRSLAKERQSQAIGVILSGTGSDGSEGLAEIKAAGGITFAQDEASARFPAMPLNAIAGGCIDLILPPEEIARELARIGGHAYLDPARGSAAEGELEEDFKRILARLRSVTGVDFSHYRDTTIRRRMARRMAIQRLDTLAEYMQLLERSPPEVEALYQDILINVTSFFRDPEVFEALKRVVFPEIIRNKSPEVPIRIWVPGCSAGQEVYSLAIALLEYLDQKPMRPPIQIFGTDINDAVSVEKARLGFYPQSIESEVSPERLRRFFTREDHGYRIGKAIRDMCVFARQNVAAHPPFSRLDLISCRNLLIYLSAQLQKRVIPTFHYGLNAGGFLLLGTSEGVGWFSNLFGPVDKPHSIYVKIAALGRPYPYFASEDYQTRVPAAKETAEAGPVNVADMQKEADRVVLGQYAPAGVLVNEELEILQFRGRTGAYLEPAPGEASFRLLGMAHDGLFMELRSAIEEAKKQNAIARRSGVRLRDERETRAVNLQVIPIRPAGSDQRCFLVLFEEAEQTERKPAAEVATSSPTGQAVPADADEVAQLRRELAESKEYQQAIIEEQSAANEELKSANEEILSSNEELQSTNEELQTAKEEVQSTNEELRTVNDELQSRNQEISLVNDDLANTLASVKIPMVMLGNDLRIRRFTPAAGTLLNLIPTDLGRPLGNIRPSFDVPDLDAALLEVIARVAVLERELQDKNGRWHLLRMHPYRTADNRIDGVVLVLHDFTERRQAELESARAREEAETANRAKDEFLAVLSHELRTPLAPILAAASLLGEDPRLETESRESVAIIQRNAELEARLIDDLLDMTRIAHSKIVLKRHPVELHTIIRGAVEVCKSDIEIRRLHFGTDLVKPSPLVHTDAARIQQVFWNLLKNAIKFTPLGGCVGIRCWRDNDHAITEINDSGVGIEPDILIRLFKPFEQGGNRTTRRFGGLGLGLTISKTLVELHGGTITARSEGHNKGATFTVTLPICESTPIALETKPQAGTTGSQPAQRRLHILLVEDHGDTARIMKRLLVKWGHDVETVAHVVTATGLIAQGSFDLLISDMGLPDGNGIDLLRHLRTHGFMLPAIALSGFGLPEDITRSKSAGFSEHLVKPVDFAELRRAIECHTVAK